MHARLLSGDTFAVKLDGYGTARRVAKQEWWLHSPRVIYPLKLGLSGTKAHYQRIVVIVEHQH